MKLADSMTLIRRPIAPKKNLSTINSATLSIYCILLAIHCVENTSLVYLDLAWMKWMFMFRNGLYVLLLFKAGFLSVYRIEELWSILGILIAGGLCMLCCDDFTMLEFVIAVIAFKDLPPRKLVKLFYRIKLSAIIITILLTMLNILPNIIYANGNNDVFYTYGFCHRNVLGANMTVVCLAWLYLHYNNLKWQHLIKLGLVTLATYLLVRSRAALLIMVLTISVMFLSHCFERKLLRMHRLSDWMLAIFIGLFLFSLIGTIFFDPYDLFWVRIDSFFTKRLRFANQCLQDYGLSLFGQKLPFTSSSDTNELFFTPGLNLSFAFLAEQVQAICADFAKMFLLLFSRNWHELLNISASNVADIHFSIYSDRLILDNAYMRVLLYHGVIPGGLSLAAYGFAIRHTWSRRNLLLLTSLMVMAVYGMFESFMFDTWYNFPLTLALMALFRHPKAQTNEPFYLPFEYAHIMILKISKWASALYKRRQALKKIP